MGFFPVGNPLPAIEKTQLLPSARLTVYSEPATRSVVAAHHTRIQLKPRIDSMGGFKAMQLGRNSLVFRATKLPVTRPI